jgi:hypothetical protein
MENYILNLKSSNSYLRQFEIAKFNFYLMSIDNRIAGFKPQKLQSSIEPKRIISDK